MPYKQSQFRPARTKAALQGLKHAKQTQLAGANHAKQRQFGAVGLLDPGTGCTNKANSRRGPCETDPISTGQGPQRPNASNKPNSSQGAAIDTTERAKQTQFGPAKRWAESPGGTHVRNKAKLGRTGACGQGPSACVGRLRRESGTCKTKPILRLRPRIKVRGDNIADFGLETDLR